MKKIIIPIAVSLITIFTACNSNSSDIRAYQKLVDHELGRNVREDSIFMGIYLGMPSKDFYAHCWNMNRQGLFTNGSNNTSVLWKMPAAFDHPVEVNFYPSFHDGKIFKMWATFNYEAWAPWNKHLTSDSLKMGVMELMKKWYGDKNIVELKDTVMGNIFVKVDGNRRITIGRYDDIKIKVDYTDLLVEKELLKK